MQIKFQSGRHLLMLVLSATLCSAMALPVSALAQNAPPSSGASQSASGGAQGGAPGGPPSMANMFSDDFVEENPPVIDTIEIKGSTKFSQQEMLKVLTLHVGDTTLPKKVKESCNNIAALYQKQGLDVAVSPNITHPSEGHVQVVLTVNENGKGGFSF